MEAIKLKETLDKTGDVTEALALAAGYFSMCWDEDGVFQSGAAADGVKVLHEWLHAHKDII